MAIWLLYSTQVGTCTHPKSHDSFVFHSHYALFHVAVTHMLLISEFYPIYFKFHERHDVHVISKQKNK